MRKILTIILLAFNLTSCTWLGLVEPTLEIVDGVEKLSQPPADVEENSGAKKGGE